MQWRNGDYLITTDPAQVDVDFVAELLSTSYWAAGRRKEVIAKSVNNSLCFSLLLAGEQIGFSRVVTDRATFAWICDVIIVPAYRGLGLGKWILSCITQHPHLRDAQMVLKTKDAHGLYEQFGFERSEFMRRRSGGSQTE